MSKELKDSLIHLSDNITKNQFFCVAFVSLLCMVGVAITLPGSPIILLFCAIFAGFFMMFLCNYIFQKKKRNIEFGVIGVIFFVMCGNFNI